MMHGIQLLRLLQFDRQIICERRQRSELTGNDVLVWTNARFVHWARSIDLGEYADNLKGERQRGEGGKEVVRRCGTGVTRGAWLLLC